MENNQKVTIVVKTPWATTEEERVIESLTENEIFIKGLDVPFDRKTGVKTESFLGSKVFIKELSKYRTSIKEKDLKREFDRNI